jgi:hypothetical protein
MRVKKGAFTGECARRGAPEGTRAGERVFTGQGNTSLAQASSYPPGKG